ncbi:MAG TPA: DUF969 domain-containing protein [Firmicutes bacterium]|nr:DUF969 domain-containing protein [Bacillota bacterium]
MIKLIGILIVVVGLALKQNPVATVFVSGIVTGLVVNMPVTEILESIGTTFVANRTMLVFLLTLPAIGLLERHGLKEYSAKLITSIKAATAGRVISIYLFLRWISSVLGLRLGGHPVFVRPLLVPMAEGAVTADDELRPKLPHVYERVKGLSAAAENYGNFFGQNIFVAASGLLLIKGVMDAANYPVDLGKMALYSLPGGIVCLILAGIQFMRFDTWAKKEVDKTKGGQK